MFREGRYLETPAFPAKLGYEAAGVVDAVGSDVDKSWLGKQVSTVPAFVMTKYGVYREVAIVPVSAIAVYPDKLTAEQGTSIWMQYLTAYGGLVEYGKVTKGDFVVLTAASSSVGIAAIEIVNVEGATSIATTRTAKKKKALMDAGAKHVIVTEEEDFLTRVKEITGSKGPRVTFTRPALPLRVARPVGNCQIAARPCQAVALTLASNYNSRSESRPHCSRKMKHCRMTSTRPSPKQRKPPTLQYVCLAFLFVVACGYQVRATIWAFPSFFGLSQPSWPFYPGYTHGELRTVLLSDKAKAAGMRENDVVVAINGRPFAGTAVFGEAMSRAKPGDALEVTIRTPPSTAELTVRVPLERHTSVPSWALASIVLLKIVLPFFSIFLGCWVVLARPRDPAAWLLVGVLLGMSNIFSAGIESWGPGIRDISAFYRAACSDVWPICMFYFGLVFPEPFPPGKIKSRMRIAERILIPALIFIAVTDVVTSIGEVENFDSVVWLDQLTDRLSPLFFLILVAAISTFFASIWMKSSVAISADARRRLRLLYWGTCIAIAPTFILIVIAKFKGSQLDLLFPKWLELSALTLMLLFPITLAYVIVVQRALDVRVVVRQGLQYALARGTVRVVRGALTVGLIWASISLLQRSKSSSLRFYFIIAAAIVVGLGLRNFGDWLRTFTDRRFFRDAARAEHILASLSDEVRSIVETRPLLERVASKVGEALFVPRVAVLLENGGAYRPAYALGYSSTPAVEFPKTAETVQRLCREPEPERVYFDDEESWVNSAALTDEERSKLEALAPQLLVPLSVKEKLLGIISLGEKKSEEPYSGSDVRLLKSVAAQTGLALANAELTTAIAEEVARREKLNREVEIAREVQERLFPQRLPPIAGLDYFGRCRTALGVGGDYYDFLALPDGKLGVALGDVSGKGIAAALMMASLEASIRAEAMRAGNDLAGMIGRVNRMIYDASAEDRYATLFYGQYEPASRRLSYVNAGHCAPMLFRRAKSPDAGPVAPRQGATKVDRLDQAGGPVVGLMPDCPYEQADVCMSPGDVLVVYTDGISEAMNQALEEWGEQRLIAAVGSADGQTAEQIIARILQAADAFAAGAPQHDDMTLVVLRARPD